ncbi:unnamed protein product [Vitrella brassicaformis CCMP3155]|uniref:Uncharacterized protein n=1 Tax=Vitrella brassicaformis (strain CCMP3155) TaxID=1169540 RepID=A0A0G4FF64_VITBC|nr:unnamed protein product [Vitrella brassicaformis CCMP3155]|eukprot:CEM11835.1 unnamed protein product [Vitrella brassicaformis CCMP3155]
MPVAVAGQPGPLARLECIGTVLLGGDFAHPRAAVDRLRAALWSRGCRQSLTQLTLRMGFYSVYSSVLPLMQSVESLHRACCRPDAPVIFENSIVGSFELSIFNSDDFPPNPSPLFKTIMQHLARQTSRVFYTITQHDLTHPVDSPSDAAVDVASSLSFDRAAAVFVQASFQQPPPSHTPSPQPTIIEHLQPLPRATTLLIHDRLGVSAGRLLADKLANHVAKVETLGPPAVDALGVLGGLGGGRVVRQVSIDPGELGTEEIVVAAAGLTNLPMIDNLCFKFDLDEMSVEDAGSRIRAVFTSTLLSALFSLFPGLQTVDISFFGLFAYCRAVLPSIRAAFPDGSSIGRFPVTVKEIRHTGWHEVRLVVFADGG